MQQVAACMVGAARKLAHSMRLGRLNMSMAGQQPCQRAPAATSHRARSFMQVTQLLEDPERLRSTGSNAAARAREWTEEANAAELIRMIHSVT